MAMELEFTKMHGLGNDFVVLDGVSQELSLDGDQIRQIADRHFGIGCDQVLLVQAAKRADVDFYYRIFNADGGEVEQCGNGARCFARYVYDRGMINSKTIRVETISDVLELIIQADGEVEVNMGVPQFQPALIPFTMEKEAAEYHLPGREKNVTFGAVSMGNPHAVIQVNDVSTAPVDTLGPHLEKHVLFPRGTNVGFMEVVTSQHIRLRVYERGTGETLACGSGACAAVAVGQIQGILQQEVQIDLPGGTLSVSWQGRGHPLFMKGPVAYVFEGKLSL